MFRDRQSHHKTMHQRGLLSQVMPCMHVITEDNHHHTATASMYAYDRLRTTNQRRSGTSSTYLLLLCAYPIAVWCEVSWWLSWRPILATLRAASLWTVMQSYSTVQSRTTWNTLMNQLYYHWTLGSNMARRCYTYTI